MANSTAEQTDNPADAANVIFQTLAWVALGLFGSAGASLLLAASCRRLAKAHAALTLLGLSLCWYGCSITFTLFNKFVLRTWMGSGFQFPLFVALLQLILKWGIAWTAIRLRDGRPPVTLTWAAWIRYAAPVGAATSLDISLTNAAVMLISITLMTILKSLALVWNYLICISLRMEKIRLSLVATIALLTAGVMCASYGEIQFQFVGMVCALAASVLAATRWVITQRFLDSTSTESRGGEKDSLLIVYAIAPAGILTLIPPMLIFEVQALSHSLVWTSGTYIVQLAGIAAGGAVLAILLLLVELAVVKRTSSLTLNVIGHVKEACQIVLSVIVFHDVLSPVNWVGVVLAVSAAGVYTHLRAASDAHAAYAPVSRVEDVDTQPGVVLSPIGKAAPYQQ